MDEPFLWDNSHRSRQGFEIVEERNVDDDIIYEGDDQDQYDQQESSHPGDYSGEQLFTVGEQIIEVPQENMIYLTDEGVVNDHMRNIGVRDMGHLIEQQVQEAETKIIGDNQDYTETVEEVITEEDWIQSQGEECVQVAMEQIITSDNIAEEDPDTVPLQTDQDEYTTSRPYPCDFCSRRFRKKANLMNHMVAHQNDRPHVCNLCGARYIRRCDLLNHLKIHAYSPDLEEVASQSNRNAGYDDPLDFNDSAEDEDNATRYNSKRRNDSDYYSKPKTSGGKKSIEQKSKPAKKTVIKQEKIPPKVIDDTNEYNVTYSHDGHRDLRSERFAITDPRKPFVCQHCGVSFTRQKALESHSRLHESDVTHDCDVCGDTLYDPLALEEHMIKRHTNINQAIKSRSRAPPAIMLPTDFEPDDSNSDYEPKVETEDDDEDYADEGNHYCDQCGDTFARADLLKKHIKSHYNNIKSELISDDEDNYGRNTMQHCCNQCGAKFSSALDLLAHAEEHTRFQQFKCQLCGEAFLDDTKIKLHLSAVHSGELNECSCKLCGKQCRDQRSLIKHSWEHSSGKSHPCSKCGKTFHNKARLKRHMVSHRNKSVICEVCNDEFPDGRSLMNHRHSHTKSNQFPCSQCGKSFGSRSSQQIHIRIHTGERPYGCRFCWKAFADGGTLRKHERIHTGEKPYACLICPRAFNQRVVLREHIRSHHSAPDPKHGTPNNPYYCAVCEDLFEVTSDLIHHIIQHCDQSTAAKRAPVTGPRKYKRRRKLKQHEIDRLNTEKLLRGDFEYGLSENEAVESPKKKETAGFTGFETSSRMIKYDYSASRGGPSSSTMSFADERNFIAPENLIPDEILNPTSSKQKPKRYDNEEFIDDMIASMAPSRKRTHSSPQSSSRPKMIHTEKSRVSVTDGKKKSKTMVVKQSLQPVRFSARSKNQTTPSKVDSEIESESEDEYVNELVIKKEGHQQNIVSDLTDILYSPIQRAIADEMTSDEDLSDVDPGRRPRRNVKSRYSAQTLKREHQIEARNKQRTTSESKAKKVIKEELDEHRCEICGHLFSSRQQLLLHVPIHI